MKEQHLTSPLEEQMGKRLKEILLVDDSPATNSLNEGLLEEIQAAEKISIALNGKEALDYLTTKDESGAYPTPEIIFLDIKMPVMDGYQFLESYHQLAQEKKYEIVVVMLTTSISEIDIERTTKYDSVKGYYFKPLTKEQVNHLMSKCFNENEEKN